ncbi:HlyD family type I secretion periplasmic adaptor subunit [Mesorhizobium sp.]|uniref:HlyD family type I secretion periplasmic adaptor subunit n=1 Tax=Mesorhizobium sp. TaxID=1871066 RepID=UPI0025B7F79E|nr:HlyD family type I secretion periplasmic adaptor subunit [Mesorhizobium sp.]
MSTLLPAVRDFQSDARKIDDRRPPRLVGATLYVLVAVIMAAGIWASVAKVDQIVVAPGKLVTTASTIVVQPLEISTVRSIDAKVGDIVRKGDALATLDATFSEADADQLRGKVTSLAAQIGRLESELDDRPYKPQNLNDEARLQSTIWIRRIEENKARLASYDRQIRNVEAQMATKSADREALEVRLGVAKDLETMRDLLVKKEVGSKIDLLSAKGQRLQVEQEILLAGNNMAELEENVERLKAEEAAYLADFRQKTAEELVQARRDHDAAARELYKAVRRNAVTVLTAPADAIVLEVAQRSVGSVLKEAEPLYTLVPLDSPLEAEVSVQGLDVGHVEPGSEVRLKLEAWPFQKHGTLSGKVRTVSDDTFTPDAKNGGQQRPYYKARVELTATDLRDVPSSFRLIPGMAVTAEIKAGDRTILSYFLYPLLRGLDESIREP